MMPTTAAMRIEPEDEGEVVFDPRGSVQRIIEGMKHDSTVLKAAANTHDPAGYIVMVRADLRAHLEASVPGGSPPSQAQVAKAMGVSPTYINQFINNKFPVPGQEAGFARSVSRYLERAGRRIDRILEAEFVETFQARQLSKILENANDNRDMVLIVGRSGIGKSIAALHFAALNRKQTIYILAGDHLRAPRAFLAHLAGLIGLSMHLRYSDLFERVVWKLRDSGRFLIVDEAEFLAGEFGDRTVEMLRQLRERTGIGLAFVSNERFWRRITGERTSEQLEKFSTRLAIRKFLKRRISKDDLEAVVHRHLNGVGKDILSSLFGRSQGAGGFRAVVHCCRHVTDLTGQNGGEVTTGVLDKALALIDAEPEDAEE